MKTLIQNYTFDPSSKTITINEVSSLLIEQLLLITNVSTNDIIYNFADSDLKATIIGNVITLNYDTTTMSDTHSLQIFVDFENTNFVELNDVLKMGIAEIVHQLQSIRNDGGMADVSGRVRCAVETLPTLGTCTTVGTVTNANNLISAGGYALQAPYVSMTNQAWGNIRNKITIS